MYLRFLFSKHGLATGLLTLAGAVWASAQPYAYVANGGNNSITVVNTANATIGASIPVPGGPAGVAITPDGSTVYLAAASDNSVSAISTASNSIITTLYAGPIPSHLAISPNGALVYVINSTVNQVSVISNSSKSVVATIGVGSRPNSVAFSADGSRAYVTNLWSNSVSVIDTSSNTVVNTFPTASGPNGVAVAPNGRIYVSCQTSSSVAVHDSSGSLLANIPGFIFPVALALTPDGSRAFVANGNGSSVSVVDTGSNSIIATTGVGPLPTSVAITADGSQALVTSEYGFSLSIISTANPSAVNTVQRVGVYPVSVAVVPGASSYAANPSPVCNFSVSAGATSFGPGGGSGSVNVSAPAGCSWNAQSNAGWIYITSGSSGSGSGSVSFQVGSNSSTSGISGSLTVAGQTVNITEAGASFGGIRVRAGGPSITDSSGNTWNGDGSGNNSVTNASIAGADVPAVYQAETWSTSTLQYQYSVPNGAVTVKLKFAEFYMTQPGQRVFNIVINGQTVAYGFDILGHVGPYTAFDLTFPVSVTNGTVTIQLVPITGPVKIDGIQLY